METILVLLGMLFCAILLAPLVFVIAMYVVDRMEEKKVNKRMEK